MASIGQFLFFIGIGLLAAGIKWGIGWVLLAGLAMLFICCAIPILRFVVELLR